MNSEPRDAASAERRMHNLAIVPTETSQSISPGGAPLHQSVVSMSMNQEVDDENR